MTESFKTDFMPENLFDNKKVISAIYNHSMDLIFIKDLNFRYLSVNEAFLKAHSVSMNDILNKTDFVFLSDADSLAVQEKDEMVLKTMETVRYNQKIISKSGREYVFETLKTPIIEDGKFVGILGISRDVTENYKLYEALEHEKNLLQTILDNIPIGMYIKDLNGILLACNKHFTKFFETKEGATGKKLYKLLPKWLAALAKKENNFVIREKRSINVKRKIDFGNMHGWYRFYKTPIINNRNEIVSVVAFSQDINSDVEFEKQRETFIATLAHDLKTPILAQTAALDLLLTGCHGSLNPDQQTLANDIYNSCKYMQNMVSTIITTYEFDSRDIITALELFDMKDFINECCREVVFNFQADKSRLRVNFKTSDFEVFADRFLIKRALIDLIATCFSYSDSKSAVEIDIKSQLNSFLFEVKTRGADIPKEELSALFGKYTSSKYKYKSVGTGLGLYLSKQIIKAHRGKLFAKSQHGKIVLGFFIPKKGRDSENQVLDIFEDFAAYAS